MILRIGWQKFLFFAGRLQVLHSVLLLLLGLIFQHTTELSVKVSLLLFVVDRWL